MTDWFPFPEIESDDTFSDDLFGGPYRNNNGNRKMLLPFNSPAMDADGDADMDDLYDVDDDPFGGDGGGGGDGDQGHGGGGGAGGGHHDAASDDGTSDNDEDDVDWDARSDSLDHVPAEADVWAPASDGSDGMDTDVTATAEDLLGPVGTPLPATPADPATDRFEPHLFLANVPYLAQNPDGVRDEARRTRRRILAGLADAVRENRLVHGVPHWIRAMHGYLDAKLPLPMLDRIKLIRVCWALITAQVVVLADDDASAQQSTGNVPMDPAVIAAASGLAVRLIKKDELLKPHASSLSLDPTSLITSIRNVALRRTTQPALPLSHARTYLSLGALLEHAVHYFPASMVTPLLQEYLPQLGTADPPKATNAWCILNLFLPPQHVTVEQSRALLAAWIAVIVHTPVADTLVLDWVTRLIQSNPAVAKVIVTDALLRDAFARTMRMLDLAVGSNDSGSATGPRGGGGSTKFEISGALFSLFNSKTNFTRVRIDAKFIVATIEHPDSMRHLTTLFRGVDSFMHPSNHGAWSQQLGKLMRGLASEFSKRLTNPSATPQELAQLRPLTRPFVALLRPHALQMLHSRDGNASSAALATIRSISAMDPSQVVPYVLAELVYPALGGLYPGEDELGMQLAMAAAEGSEAGADASGAHAQRTIAAFGALRNIAWSLVSPRQWPPGIQTHLPELLFLSLPGIDVNDHNKSVLTLLFISHIFLCIRLDSHPSLAAIADDWTIEFLARVFSLLENVDAGGAGAAGPGGASGQASKSARGGIEGNMIQALVYAVAVVIDQLPAGAYAIAARKITAWVRESPVHHAADAVAQIVLATVMRDPAAQLPQWLGWITDQIAAEVADGAATRATIKAGRGVSSDHGTAAVLTYLTIACKLATVPGDHILATRSVWERLLEALEPVQTRGAFRLSHAMVATLVRVLSGSYPRDYANTEWRRTSSAERKRAEQERAALGHVFPKPHQVTTEWYTPGEAELAFARHLVDLYTSKLESQIQALVVAAAPLASDGDAMEVDANFPRSTSPTKHALSVTTFAGQHAWIKGLSLVQNLIRAISRWTRPAPRTSRPHRRIARALHVMAGTEVEGATAHTRLAALLDTAWTVFANAADARSMDGSIADSSEATEKESGTTAATSATETTTVATTGAAAAAAAAKDQEPTHITILVQLITSTRHHLQSGKGRTVSGSSVRQRKAVARVPPGFGTGPLWDDSDPSTGAQLGSMLTTAKQFSRSVHVRRVHYIHATRQHLNAKQASGPNVGTADAALVQRLYLHALSTYSGVRRTAQIALVTVASTHFKVKQELVRRVIAAITALPDAAAMDRDERTARIRGGLLLMRSTVVIGYLAHHPEEIINVARAVLNVSRKEEKLIIVNEIQQLMTMHIFAANNTPYEEMSAPAVKRLLVDDAWPIMQEPPSSSSAPSTTTAKPGALTPAEKTAASKEAFARLLEYYQSSGADGMDPSFDAAALVNAGPHPTFPLVTQPDLHWRVAGSVLSFISALFYRPETGVPPRAIQVLLSALVAPNLNLRTAAEVILQGVQSRLKAAAGRPDSKFDLPVDDALRAYLRSEKIDSVPPVENAYLHIGSVGWMCFPATVPAYRLEPAAGPRHAAADAAAVDVFRAAYADAAWVEKLFHYLSLESATLQPGQVPQYNWNRANQLRHLLTIVGPAMAQENLVSRVIDLLAAPSDKSSRLKCGIEWATALARGSKHWPAADVQRVTQAIFPKFIAGMRAAGPDTYRMYSTALQFVLGNRDLRLVRPLTRAIMEMVRELQDDAPADDDAMDVDVDVDRRSSSSPTKATSSAFSDAKRLTYWWYMVSTLGLRASGDLEAWTTDYMVPLMDNPYKLVRDSLGGLIANSLGSLYTPAARDVDAWTAQAPAILADMAAGTALDPSTSSHVIAQAMVPVTRVLARISAATTVVTADKDRDIRVAKTVAVMTTAIANSPKPAVARATIPLTMAAGYKLMPLEDQEATMIGMTCVAYISQFDLGSTRAVREVVQAIVSLLHTLSSSSSLTSSRAASPPSLTASWQIVLKVLQHLQVLFFRHLHYLADADRAFFVDTVAEFLHDPHVEVRQLAGVTLSGLVQCTGGMREDNPVAAQVRAVAESLLAASGTALPKRRAGQPVPEGFADQIRTRHAGVLALAALVRAHPYDVPATTLPLVLVKLAHYAEDPVPVGPAVKSVFAEFKRTHAETWHRDILAFDDDQRAVLVDMLVSPSYYA